MGIKQYVDAWRKGGTENNDWRWGCGYQNQPQEVKKDTLKKGEITSQYCGGY